MDVKVDFIPLTDNRNRLVGGLVTLHDLTLARQLAEVRTGRASFHRMVGRDPSMQKIFEMASKVAPSDATVLIGGDTGTGKDLLAKAIHSASRRADRPFVKVNCAALPHNLLESEMFGYARGAFTGADQDKPGRFAEATGGTIFLDEIGDMPLSLQAKLLRVLEDKEYYPLGSRRTTRADVRIIAATNRNLEELLESHQFREDLFYRLNVCRMELPSLRERRGDLPLLIDHVLRRLAAAGDRRPPEISSAAMEIMLSLPLPGQCARTGKHTRIRAPDLSGQPHRTRTHPVIRADAHPIRASAPQAGAVRAGRTGAGNRRTSPHSGNPGKVPLAQEPQRQGPGHEQNHALAQNEEIRPGEKLTGGLIIVGRALSGQADSARSGEY